VGRTGGRSDGDHRPGQHGGDHGQGQGGGDRPLPTPAPAQRLKPLGRVDLDDATLQRPHGPLQPLLKHGRPPRRPRAGGQGLAGAVELGLDRPLGHAQGLGDLGHRGVAT
jgi:hypothetical protein